MRVVAARETDASWDALIATDPDATIHHEAAWVETLCEVYPGWRPLYLIARDDAGRVRGGLPAVESSAAGIRQLLSLPYGMYGQPLTASPGNTAAVREALLGAWVARAERPGTARAHLEWFARHAPYTPSDDDARWTEKRSHLLDLTPGYEAVWKSFQSRLRGACRQAERLGVTVVRDPTPSGRDVFVRMYRAQAASWPGHTPVRSELFHRVLDRFPDRASLWVAAHGGLPVAATLVLRSRDMAAAWLTVQDPDARSLRAGSLLYHAAIDDACSQGLNVFNFGSSQGAVSIEFFKESFGATPFDYVAWHRDTAWFRILRRLRGTVRAAG